MAIDTARAPRLCFLANNRLQAPLLDRLEVQTREGIRIGTFDGVIVDPAARRVRYLVVDCDRPSHNRCLVPLLPACLDIEHSAIRVDADDVESTKWPEFDAATFPQFTDDDEITALLAPRP